MKILNYDPHSVSQPAKPQAKPQASRTQTFSFESELAKSGQPASPSLRAVFSENLKASQQVSPEDLGAAGQLLNSLLDQIRSAKPADLQKVHNLEGILYYSQI
ncbi:MAG: hypothetical protein LBK52_03265 [Deltaproteobacteria bacterium]|jgi:hypothetical protein|nr:hypothetical protein [Deltaproteobacteria bacterium]